MMSSLPRTTLLVFAAFLLGLTFGGETPRHAVAADAPPGGLGWEMNGGVLTLTNWTKDVEYLVLAWRWDGEEVALTTRAEGKVEIATDEYQKILVHRMEGAFVCDDRGCRPCNEGRIACPIPEPIFVERSPEMTTVIDPRRM
jgi:hypothetical protein